MDLLCGRWHGALWRPLVSAAGCDGCSDSPEQLSSSGREERDSEQTDHSWFFFYYLKCFIVVSFNGEPKSFLMDTSWNLSLSQGDVNQKSNKSGYFFEKTFIYLRHFTWIMFSHEFEGCGIILTFVFVNCEKLLQKDA